MIQNKWNADEKEKGVKKKPTIKSKNEFSVKKENLKEKPANEMPNTTSTRKVMKAIRQTDLMKRVAAMRTRIVHKMLNHLVTLTMSL
jgi:hypothetical protein